MVSEREGSTPLAKDRNGADRGEDPADFPDFPVSLLASLCEDRVWPALRVLGPISCSPIPPVAIPSLHPQVFKGSI